MLAFPKALWMLMRQHGEATYPHECCGILLGRESEGGREVVEVVRCHNERANAAHDRYSIAPLDLIKTERQARERGLEILGFYHSHPDHPAQWSATDLAEAHWLGSSYVITAVEKGKAQQTNAFLLHGESEETKRFEAESIEVSERPAGN